MTQPIDPADLELLPEKVQVVVGRFQKYTMMNFSDSEIVISALIDSQKRVRELETNLKNTNRKLTNAKRMLIGQGPPY